MSHPTQSDQTLIFPGDAADSTAPVTAIRGAQTAAQTDVAGGSTTPHSESPQAAPEQAKGAYPRLDGYEILGELGRGGMGVVYKARYVALDRVVALKMILSGGHASATDLARFKAEALAVSRLQHTNIVQIFATGDDDGRPFFSLEFCGGGSLEGRLKGQPQPPATAAAMLQILALAIHAAHERGIVHRDLKPANVLLAADGTPKITDFGLAKKVEEDGSSSGQTASGTIMGTPSYMAPEQAAGQVKEIGPAVDVYALGAMLYECLVGRPPFRADTLMHTLRQVLEEEPVPPRRLQAKVPVDLETICLKCLEKTPTKRYASAKDLADDLGRFLAGEPILARPVGTLARVVKWARRRPAVAALSAMILLLVAVGFGLVTWKWLEADRQRRRADEARQNAEDERLHALAEQRKAELVSTLLAFQQGLELCDRGEVPSGMLRMARSLDMAVRFQATDLERVIRANLGAWSSRMHPLRWRLDHPQEVHAAAIGPDGTRVATGCQDGKLRLWDTKTGQTVFEHQHTAPIRAAAFSPDGKTLLAAAEDGAVWFVDVAQPKAVTVESPHRGNRVVVALFSRTGTVAVTADKTGLVQCWDPNRGAPLFSHNFSAEIRRADLSADGKVLVLATGKEVQVLYTATREAKTLKHENLGVVNAVSVSPDGASVVAGCSSGRLFLFDPSAGTSRDFKHGVNVWAVSFHPGGERTLLSSSRDNNARIWDFQEGEPHDRLQLKHANQVFAAGYSPDGKTIATGSRDGVRLWQADTGEQLGAVLPDRMIGGAIVAFSADGRTLLTRSADLTGVRVWDIMLRPEVKNEFHHSRDVRTLQLGRDGNALLTGSVDGCTRLWKRHGDGWQIEQEFDEGGHRLAGAAFHDSADRRILMTAWLPRPEKLATGLTVRTIVNGAVEKVVLPHPTNVQSVAISPDGRTLAAGSADKTVRLWHRQDFAKPPYRELKAPTAVHTVCFSNDSKTLACAFANGKVWVWDVARLEGDQNVEPRLTLEHQDAANCLAFSPRGDLILTGSSDRTARLWYVDTGVQARPPLVHGGSIRAAAFNADGSRVITGCTDGTVRLWDVATAQPLGPAYLVSKQGWASGVAFAPESTSFLFGGDGPTSGTYVIPGAEEGSAAAVMLRVQLRTGLELVEDASLVRSMTAESYDACRRRLMGKD